jgi:Tfp pilus assembly protein PilV
MRLGPVPSRSAPPPSGGRPRGGRGMTLVEVMMATAVLVFGMVAILAIILTAQRAHQRAVNETNAVLVANSVLSEWRASMDRGNPPTPTPPNSTYAQLPIHKDYPDYRYAVSAKEINAQRRPANAPALGQEYLVEVTVYWAQRGEQRSMSFQTVMFQRSW